MTAFDTAWALLKMPVVQGSYSKEGKWPSALFEDPITNEILPMHILPAEGESTTYILNQGGDKRLNVRGAPKISDIRSVAHFGRESDKRMIFDDEEGNPLPISEWIELSPYYTSADTNTDEKYRRRGYATALYDLASRYVSEENTVANPDEGDASRITYDAELLDNGEHFWENAKRTGKANENYEWRVRDDL